MNVVWPFLSVFMSDHDGKCGWWVWHISYLKKKKKKKYKPKKKKKKKSSRLPGETVAFNFDACATWFTIIGTIFS